MAAAPPKTKKIKTTVTENGVEKEVEIEVPDLEASWGTPETRRNTGAPLPRVDGYDKVTGRAKYTYDINLPGMLHGAIVRCPHGKARITSIDVEAAKRLPGVKAVVALKQAGNVALYAGDEVLALAAVTSEAAEHAKRMVNAEHVKYEALPFVVHSDQARQPDAPKVLANERPNVEPGQKRATGDVEKAFAEAAGTIEGTYHAQARVHACLETHGHVVAYQQDGTVKVWASTQAVHGTADEFANIVKMPRDRVEVITQHMGGGFGSKFGPGVEGRAAALLAQEAKAPVKLMLDRRDEAESAGNAPNATMTAKFGASKDGTITAAQGRGFGTGGIGGAGIEFPYGIYRIENVDAQQETVRTNVGPSNAMRAPGRPQASFITESAIDELAYKIGMDPLEMRIKNDPSPLRQAQLRMGAERIGWKQKFNKTPGQGKGPLVTGVGCAGTAWGGRGGRPEMKAEVRIAPDGSVVVSCGTQDLGTGVRSFMPAIVADELGLTRDMVRSEIGNSKLPLSGGSGGSTTTPMVAPAVKMAAAQAKFDFLSTLSKATGTPLEKLDLLPGGKVTNGEKTLTWQEACKRLPAGGVTSQGSWIADLVTGPVAGAQLAEVAVDMETGRVFLKKIVAIHDCGIVMNRLLAETQIISGVIQGIGFAMTEFRQMDYQTGRMLNADMEWYKLPGPREMPEIEAIVQDNPDAKGVSGFSEACVIPTASAIANAVYNASGARVRMLPILPRRVLTALGKAPAETGRLV